MQQDTSNPKETNLTIPLNMRLAGINTIEKLASTNINDLLKIKGINRSEAIKYINIAKKYVKNNNSNNLKLENSIESNAINETKEEDFKAESDIRKEEKRKNNGKSKRKKYDFLEELEKLSPVDMKKKDIKKDNMKDIKEKNNAKTKIQNRAKEKETQKDFVKVGYLEDLFPEEIIQKIRFLHFKIKKIEESLQKEDEGFKIEDLPLIEYYVKILNINYKLKNQNLILSELGLTSTYYDPIEDENIIIYDIMFECARVLWVLTQAYTQISEKYEKENDLENAILAMVKCSQAYKSASYFSAAAVNQVEKGKVLDSETLEYKSEEARIIAQSLAALNEEKKNNLALASQAYAGLSALSKRMLFLKDHEKKIRNHLIGQSYFDLGKSCYVKALSIQKSLLYKESKENNEKAIKDLLNKASYYYHKSEGVWEDLLRNNKENMSEGEIDKLRINLSIVNESIIECNASPMEYDQVKDIMDPDPYIMIPENLAHIMPKTTTILSQINSMDVNVNVLKKFKNKKLEVNSPESKRRELLSKKAGVGRTIKELKTLYKNNDIDVDTYAELLEKYNTKIKTLDQALEKLDIN
jgi:hypothetical protein